MWAHVCCCCLLVLAGALGMDNVPAATTIAAAQDARGWQGAWHMVPSRTHPGWDAHARISMLTNQVGGSEREEEARGKNYLKKYKRYMLPLLLAYKLKFFTLIPILIGGLVLLTGATGLAGFFFALFAATMGLKSGDH